MPDSLNPSGHRSNDLKSFYHPEIPPEYSDEALTLRFTDEHQYHLRYIAASKQWMHWDGQVWRPEKTLLVQSYARDLCRQASVECEKPNVGVT